MIGQASHRAFEQGAVGAAGFGWRARPRRAGSAARAAFSLAEMMIALVILGFGLLIVGAALPVGLTYQRETIDKSTGDAAVEHALDLIEQHIRLCRDPWENSDPDSPYLRHYIDIFQPRQGVYDLNHGEVLPDYEPLVKVRPLLPVAIDPSTAGEVVDEHQRDVVQRLGNWLMDVGVTLEPEETREVDGVHWVAPALPSICAVYPPISADTPFSVGDFLPPPAGDPYTQQIVSAAERLKAMDRRITWTAFYRRVSYAPGSDPNYYEVIVVAVRRPSDGHRFPRFDPAGDIAGTGAGPAPLVVGDTLAPVPFLAAFSVLPELTSPGDYDGLDRVINPTYADPPTLTFVVSADIGPLLPPGSIFIPAVNDRAPSHPDYGEAQAGFVPHAPDALPIYKVLERSQTDDTYAVIVENNGFYPWTVDGNPDRWPVWIIPPAYKELDSAGEPVFEGKSSIVAWGRRFVHFREIP